ncbi:MAG: glucosaminidase domain-containing protein [Saprospiraceae bacterium]|jgi:hypothetical protein
MRTSIWQFVKTYWFSTALVILFLLAIIRHFGLSPSATKRVEKFTDEPPVTSGSASMLGILPGSAQTLQAMPEVEQATATAFLRRFAPVAVSERKKYGVPAAVSLGFAYVNSFSGQRETALHANNYFSLRCTADWEGQTYTGNGQCYRRYDTAWESFRDFSVFMSSRDWYGPLRQKAGKDWRIWIRGLSDKDISDVSNLEAEMEQVIVQYRLHDLDN